MEVVATGKITTFAGKSSYQLVIEQMEIAGAGALLKLLEERKQKFAAEGLFDPAHKKPVPFLPDVIGVVTSASGAVIRDIIHRVRDRFPSRIIVWPSPRTGRRTAEKIGRSRQRPSMALPRGGAVPRPDVHVGRPAAAGSLRPLAVYEEIVQSRLLLGNSA